ncbi:hypothetical protein [Microvirga antarctica]|nr:hypothetical protein [Microvirga antarctica]
MPSIAARSELRNEDDITGRAHLANSNDKTFAGGPSPGGGRGSGFL